VVAALYVQTGGVYYGLDDVDPWDEARDARLYAGPWPVVAHPPCTAWCILSNCRPEIVRGEDGGCFEAALASVRRFGGVLEHPRYSQAWAEYGLPQPSRYGWTQAMGDPGVSTEIDQGAYGHPTHKPTWLYFVGDNPPLLQWERSDKPTYRDKRIGGGPKGSVRSALRSRSPEPFRDVLLAMARSASRERVPHV
jgi:hypothetical protein